MAKSQPEKLAALIKAWFEDAVRGEVIPADYRRRLEIVSNPEKPSHADTSSPAAELDVGLTVARGSRRLRTWGRRARADDSRTYRERK